MSKLFILMLFGSFLAIPAAAQTGQQSGAGPANPFYSSLTDASGLEMVDITQESGRQTRNLRMALLILNFAHNNEIYGNMVTYMRIKDIVPTSSEPRPQQQQPR